MTEQKDQLIEKIISFYLGELSEIEKAELQTWVNASQENREEFKRIVSNCHRLKLATTHEQADIMRENVIRKCLQQNRQKQNRRFIQRIACAAVLVLSLSTGYFFYSNPSSSRVDTMKNIDILQAGQGEQIAILKSASGQEWKLKNNHIQELNIGGNVILKGDSLQQEISTSQEANQQIEGYHILTVPIGGEYHLTLMDGTNVWLNSDSELKFPTRFSENCREIYLKGEAFFEVVSDSLHPFIVRTGEADIKVTGTAFNVMNYTDEKKLEVALQQGKIEFKAKESQQIYLLQPGHVITMNKENTFVSLENREISQIGTWRTGYFYFEDMPLEELTMKLERWYQVKFVFANEEIKQMRFTGAIKKYRSLNSALKIIEKTKDIVFMASGEEIRIVRK